MGNLWERATIPFANPLAEREIKRLFHYLVSHIPRCTINYSIDKKGRASTDPKTSKSSIEEYASGVSASISSISNDELRMGTFEGVRDPLTETDRRFWDRHDLFFGVRFFVTPGYEEEEVPKPELALMDEVRQRTQEFFESHGESKE